MSYVFVGLWDLRLFSSDAFFLRTFTYTCAQYASMNELTCSEQNASLENSLYEFCYLYSISKR